MTHQRLGTLIALTLLALIGAGLMFAHWHGYQNNRCNTHDPVVVCQWWQAP